MDDGPALSAAKMFARRIACGLPSIGYFSCTAAYGACRLG